MSRMTEGGKEKTKALDPRFGSSIKNVEDKRRGQASRMTERDKDRKQRPWLPAKTCVDDGREVHLCGFQRLCYTKSIGDVSVTMGRKHDRTDEDI